MKQFIGGCILVAVFGGLFAATAANGVGFLAAAKLWASAAGLAALVVIGIALVLS